LVVVIAAISQQQSSLAIGNILGSSISNILGAFSLGLIFSPSAITFDRSSKIYTAVLLALTSLFAVFIVFFESLGRIGGAVLVATFAAYVASIGWAIYKGIVAPPEDDSDSDSESDSDSDLDSDDEPSNEDDVEKSRSRSSSTTTLTESLPLAKEMFEDVDLQIPSPNNISQRKAPHSTLYHIVQLIIGFLALTLSGYVLSHSISTIADAFSLSGTVLGITFLSFATTLPEKLVSIFSGARKQGGIIVANTAGSNIFLVTLCAGVLFLTGDLEMLKGSVDHFDVFSMWVSSLLLFIIVMTAGRRWIGWALFALYIVFIVLEFTAPRV
jgi:Ca2+/Na+ antiporter